MMEIMVLCTTSAMIIVGSFKHEPHKSNFTKKNTSSQATRYIQSLVINHITFAHIPQCTCAFIESTYTQFTNCANLQSVQLVTG